MTQDCIVLQLGFRKNRRTDFWLCPQAPKRPGPP